LDLGAETGRPEQGMQKLCERMAEQFNGKTDSSTMAGFLFSCEILNQAQESFRNPAGAQQGQRGFYGLIGAQALGCVARL